MGQVVPGFCESAWPRALAAGCHRGENLHSAAGSQVAHTISIDMPILPVNAAACATYCCTGNSVQHFQLPKHTAGCIVRQGSYAKLVPNAQGSSKTLYNVDMKTT